MALRKFKKKRRAKEWDVLSAKLEIELKSAVKKAVLKQLEKAYDDGVYDGLDDNAESCWRRGWVDAMRFYSIQDENFDEQGFLDGEIQDDSETK